MTTTHKTTGRPRHFLPVQAVAGLVISVAGLLLLLPMGGQHTPVAEVTAVDLLQVLVSVGMMVGGITIAAIAEPR